MSLVSIIIPVFNSAPTLERCLRSVADQQTTADLDIIMIDDGSTDDSVEIAERTGICLRIVQQANAGVASARNRGIAMALGEYIAFLDADDYWDGDFLATTTEFLTRHREVVAVSVGQRHRVFGKADSIVPRTLAPNEAVTLAALVLEDFWEFWGHHNHICTGSALMRTDVVRRAGGQRDDLHICEDLEYWAYLSTFGKWGVIPRVLFTSDGGAVTRSRGWYAKNYRRWASAPTVADWERRILPRITPAEYGVYSVCRGRIARNLAYSMIQSGRDGLAFEAVQEFGDYFPNDRVSRILCRSQRRGKAVWSAMCLLLRARERVRAFAIWRRQ